MVGDEVTSLISRTIVILQTTTKEYNTVKDDKGLRKAFHEAGRGLLLVQQALEAAEPHLDTAGDPPSALSPLVACNTKAKLSEGIFKEVAKAPEASRFERYKVAVRQEGKGNTVEVLVTGMMKDICDLAEDDAIKAALEARVKGLRDAIDKPSKMEPSVPNDGPGHMFSNFNGEQFNAVSGTQNISKGSGNHFPGATIGTANFANP